MENKSARIQIKKKKKKTICESDDKQKEQQKDKHEDVKKDTKTIKCGEGEEENVVFFF